MAVTSSPSTNIPDLIEIGFIRAAHGLRGQVVVHAHSQDAASLMDYGPLLNADGSKSYRLEVTSDQGKDFLCKIEGITDRNQAEALRGTKLFIPASSLPEPEEGQFYIKDLIGLRVENDKGVVLGKVVDVLNLGANDAFDIEFTHDGEKELETPQTELLLFIDQYILNVDIDGGKIVVDLPYGLLGEPEKKLPSDK